MRSVARIISWIDRGYDDGVATSNKTLGLIISVLGLLALSIDMGAIRWAVIILAALVLALSGWRMLLSFRRLMAAESRGKRRKA